MSRDPQRVRQYFKTAPMQGRSIVQSRFVGQALLPLLIFAGACRWLLPSLGNGMLWQDEAQTALLGRIIHCVSTTDLIC